MGKHGRRRKVTGLLQNLEDPNERGYDAIRREFLREMARVLAPR